MPKPDLHLIRGGRYGELRRPPDSIEAANDRVRALVFRARQLASGPKAPALYEATARRAWRKPVASLLRFLRDLIAAGPPLVEVIAIVEEVKIWSIEEYRIIHTRPTTRSAA